MTKSSFLQFSRNSYARVRILSFIYSSWQYFGDFPNVSSDRCLSDDRILGRDVSYFEGNVLVLKSSSTLRRSTTDNKDPIAKYTLRI